MSADAFHEGAPAHKTGEIKRTDENLEVTPIDATESDSHDLPESPEKAPSYEGLAATQEKQGVALEQIVMQMDEMRRDFEAKLAEQASAHDAERTGYETTIAELKQQNADLIAKAAQNSTAEAGSRDASVDQAKESGSYFNGKKVSVEILNRHPDNREDDELLVKDNEGNEYQVTAKDIVSHDNKSDKEPDTVQGEYNKITEAGNYYDGKKVYIAEKLSEDSANNENDKLLVVDDDGNEYKVSAKDVTYRSTPVGKVLELYKEPLFADLAKKQEKEPSRLDKMKSWFKKERRYLQEYGGIDYFTQLAIRASNGLVKNTFDAGVKEGMSKQEIESKRKRNRIVILAGVGAIAAAALLIHRGQDSSLNDMANDTAGAVGLGDGFGVDPDGVEPSTDVMRDILDRPDEPTDVMRDILDRAEPDVSEDLQDVLDGKTPPTYEVPDVSTAEAPIPSEAFTVQEGGGGEALFNNLGIDPAKWYANENALLEKFPNDFYRMTDGHVGITRPGPLPQGVQEFIINAR